MFCKRCGWQITERVDFCPNCGDPISKEEWERAERLEKQQGNRKKRQGIRTNPGQSPVNPQRPPINPQRQSANPQRTPINPDFNGNNRTRSRIIAVIAAVLLVVIAFAAGKAFGGKGKNTEDSSVSYAESVHIEDRQTESVAETESQENSESGQTNPKEDETSEAPENGEIPEAPEADTAPAAAEAPENFGGTETAEESNASEAEESLPENAPKAEESLVSITPMPEPSNEPDEMIILNGGIEAPAKDFIFPHSSEILLTEQDIISLMELDPRGMHYQTQLAISEIFARYGYAFNLDTYTGQYANAVFGDKGWYMQAMRVNPERGQEKLLKEVFNSTEKANVQTLMNAQTFDYYKDQSGDVQKMLAARNNGHYEKPRVADEDVAYDPGYIWILDRFQAPNGDFVFPHSSTTVLSTLDFCHLLKLNGNERYQETKLAINEIFARYGYTFTGTGDTSDNARAHFENKQWYQDAQRNNPTNDQKTLMESWFNDNEKLNVELLSKFLDIYCTN